MVIPNDIDPLLFKLAMLGYIIYILYNLESQGQEFQNFIKYVGIGFYTCYGRRSYLNNNNN